jgi:hypothetical protein
MLAADYTRRLQKMAAQSTRKAPLFQRNQKFGVRPLAYSRIVVPESRNTALDLQIDELLLKAGARMGERERLEFYGRTLIGEGDLPLHNPVAIMERVQDATQNQPVPAENLPQ